MHTACAPSASAFDDIGAAAKAAVDQYRHPLPAACHDFRQHVDGRRRTALLDATAMVGDDDAVDPRFGCELGILMGKNALQQELALDHVAQPLDRVPGQVGHPGTGNAAGSMPVKLGLRDR